jgi:hypothetical protein
VIKLEPQLVISAVWVGPSSNHAPVGQ